MKTTSRAFKSILLVIALIIASFHSIEVKAADDIRIVQAFVSDEDIAKLYVRGLDSPLEASYQIGNVQTVTPSAHVISEDELPMRTLIMLDNSLSIGNSAGDGLISLIQSIIENHADREQFRLALFSDQINYITDYSDDYLQLYNRAGAISYEYQDTYLTDVLVPVLTELANEGYAGYNRIVIITDGMDNKELGLTREELRDVMKERAVPIYSVGVKTGADTSNEDLEALFALSRMTGGAEFLFEDGVSGAVVSSLSGDRNIVVYEAQLPEDVKNGLAQSIKLTLSDGTALQTQLTMPQGDVQAQAPSEDPSETPPAGENDTNGDDATVRNQTNEGFISKILNAPLWLKLIVCAGILAIILIIVIAAVSASKKKDSKGKTSAKGSVSGSEDGTFLGYGPDDDKTMLDDDKTMLDNTVGLFDNAMKVTLTDENEPMISVSSNVTGRIVVGRSNVSADLVLPYNKNQLSREQCFIEHDGERLYVGNLSDSSITALNGSPLYERQELMDGDVLTMGNVRMKVRIG